MSFELNRVTLIGHAADDLMVKIMPSGTTIASFQMATNDFWIDKATGVRKEETCWHNISVNSEFLIKALQAAGFKKGCNVLVIGALRYDTWVDKVSDEKKHITRIIVKGPNSFVRVLTKATHIASGPSNPSLDDIPF